MRVLVKSAIVLVATLAVCAGVLFACRRRIVLVAFGEAGRVHKEPTFVFFNPFRDRAPEKTAVQFMTSLSSERCRELVLPLRGAYTDHICSREQEFRSTRFHLSNRKDNDGVVELSFDVDRRPTVSSNSKVTVRQDGSKWRVVDYEPIY